MATKISVIVGDALIDLPLLVKFAEDVTNAISALPPKETRHVSDDEKLAVAIITAAEPITDAIEAQIKAATPAPPAAPAA